MSAKPHQFQPGGDPRANRAGRPPSAQGFRRQILKRVGPDLPGLLDRLQVLARAGDPEATVALAGLVVAALGVPATKSARVSGGAE
jgi:hypothetical protein